jgi:hypothetical protein
LVTSDKVWIVPSGSRIVRPVQSAVVQKGNPQEAIIDFDGVCVSYEKWNNLQKEHTQ